MKHETYNIRSEKLRIKKMFNVSCFMFQEDGITLYLAMVTMSGALAIALFMSFIFIKEARISQDVVNSVKAVYVADTVMEYALYQARQTSSSSSLDVTSCSGLGVVSSLSTTAKCSVTSDPLVAKDDTSVQCNPTNYPLASVTTCTQIIASGAYGGINRRIEIVYPNL